MKNQRGGSNTFDRTAFRAGIVGALVVMVFIIVGSRNLGDFDWALTTYAVGSIFAAFAVVYRYAVWAQRPPTRLYLRRGIQAFFARKRGWSSKPRNAGTLFRLLLDNFVLQRFITRRSKERWIMHACLSWGGMLAFAVTFPLVFGWVHFESMPDNADIYRLFVIGFPVEQFDVHSLSGFLHFNLLNFSAIILLAGLVLSVKLRMSDKGEFAIQTFADDVFPILLLFAVCVTGLMLTVSAKFLAGSGFQFIGLTHAASVIGLLLYLPFGKLFHIIQRPLSLGVSFYKQAGLEGPAAHCLRCGEGYASKLHVDDLKTVLDELGFNFRFASPGGELHYQEICPPCRRRLLALNQGRALGR
ncbi:MAG TPA: MFS transporter [Terriglobia bacterium]|nr:MFS transporter [Terriglobia bacterium]